MLASAGMTVSAWMLAFASMTVGMAQASALNYGYPAVVLAQARTQSVMTFRAADTI